jgi:hypothetical protein
MIKNKKNIANNEDVEEELEETEDTSDVLFPTEIGQTAIVQLIDLNSVFTENINDIAKEIESVEELYKQIKDAYDLAVGLKEKKSTNMNVGSYDPKATLKINSFISKQTENLISLKNLIFNLKSFKYNINKHKAELNIKQYLALLRSNLNNNDENNKILIEFMKSISRKPNREGIKSITLEEKEDLFEKQLEERIKEDNITHVLENSEEKIPKKKKKYKLVYNEESETVLAVDRHYNTLDDIDTSKVKVYKVGDQYFNEETGEELEIVSFADEEEE